MKTVGRGVSGLSSLVQSLFPTELPDITLNFVKICFFLGKKRTDAFLFTHIVSCLLFLLYTKIR